MIKIYLDQKDYIRIAHGLLGDSTCQTDVEVYNYLLNLITENRIQIYYSWCHFKEAAAFSYHDINYLDKFIDVVLSLANSNCVKDHPELTKIEIELLLGPKFNFSADSASQYPFGKKSDVALSKIDENFEEVLFGRKFSDNEKKDIKRKMNRKNTSDLRNLVPCTRQFARKEIVLLFAGQNSQQRFEVVRKCLDIMFNIRFFLKNLSSLKPIQDFLDLKNKKADEMIDVILAYKMERSKGKNSLSENDVIELISKATVKSFENHVRNLATKYKFSTDEAAHFIIDNISKIHSINSYIQIFSEYLKRHKGTRNPTRNDYMDIHHMRYLPYVDYFITDRFFAEVAKGISGIFNTKVVRNLDELKADLEGL